MTSKKIIGFQGASGANSHLACQKFYFDHEARSFANFSDIFEAVAKEEIELGIIPLENSYAGRVSEIHNLLQKHDVYIIAEHFFHVSHHLAGIPEANLHEIKEAISHPQALSQCQDNLKKLRIKSVEFSNTAEAAKLVANIKDKTKAALCSKEACETYGLKVLCENMQDAMDDNITIFITISKETANIKPETAPTITALLFTIRNIPGSLYKALGGFATNGVSLIKLESYIPGGISKQAQFFISIDGHPSQHNVALALEELGFFSQNVKFLGVYFADPKRFK